MTSEKAMNPRRSDTSEVIPGDWPKRRLTENETAHYIAMSRPWLRLQRMKGTGPAFIRVGRAIRYDIRDLDAWLSKHRVETE
jgi:predicted DNA-binding transcriptional regulator AlpA